MIKENKVTEYDEEEFNEEEMKDGKTKKYLEKKDNFFIPMNNQFDFTYKPTSNVSRVENKVKPDSIQGQFIRASLKMKRQYNAQQKATFAAIKPDLNPDK
mmetsp:Transcript_28421/g.25155  ORF Transcript_28421/g.25155 Transcript_28421/m.25155 type:complete len:100 (+) Transcript_28421:151-450(+)